jgi:putative ABC transport system permease protein
MNRPIPPRLARVLLRFAPLGDRRPEVEADLLELFAGRADTRGQRYARRRYYGDVLSLWRGRGAPVSQPAIPEARPHLLEEAGQNLSYALRLLRRSPAVVAIAVLGLGLAIGVGTSVFSLLNAVAFRATGIDDPASTARVMRAYSDGIGTSWRYSEYRLLRDGARTATLDTWFADDASIAFVANAETPSTTSVMFVSGGYLASLNSRSGRGRLLAATDDVPGAAPVVVVSHSLWTRTLSSDPAVVGRTIWLNGAPFTIVGVSVRGFTGTDDSQPTIWAPIASYHLAAGGPAVDRNTPVAVNIVARLGPGVARAQAQAELSAVAAGIAGGQADSSGQTLTGVSLVPILGPINRSEASEIAIVVTIVFCVIGLLLLLACVNVTNLLLASAIGRQREFAVRLALGASRWRIVRQLMTESLLLGIAGGASGLLFTVWLVPVLASVAHAPASLDLAPNVRVYLFLGAISILAGLGAGLVPARHALRDTFASALKGSIAQAGDSSRSRAARSTLVGVQAAASLVLLVVAALLTRGMVRATHVDVGFEANRLLTVSPAFVRGTYDAAGAKAYWDLALERVRALPGVQQASLADNPPFGGSANVTIFRRAGSRYTIYHNATRAEFFATVGLRALRGRTYTAAEVDDGAEVAVISEALARDFFGAEDPVGQPLRRVIEDSRAIVIGVVSNAITARLRELGSAIVYQPMKETSGAKMLVRSAGPPEALVQSLRSALHPLDPRARLTVSLVSEGLHEQLAEPRALATIAGALAIIALALAVVGLYGVTSFVVGRRTQEIGLRMALGASSRDVMQLLVSDCLRPVLIGLAAGIVMALIVGRVFAGALFGVPPTDPIAFVTAILVLATVAAGAVIIPTRRASLVQPAAVLRQL